MFPPLEGTISPLFVVFPLVNEIPKPLHNKGKSKHLLIVHSSDLILKRRLIFRMETRDATSNAVLSLNRTALCPVYIAIFTVERTLIFWVSSLGLKSLLKLAYTLVKKPQ